MQLTGLTLRQQIFADCLWEFSTYDQLLTFINALPTQEWREEIASLAELMMIEAKEENHTTDEFPEATALINKIKKHKT